MVRGRGKLTPQDLEQMKIISQNIKYYLAQQEKKQVDLSKATGIPASTLTGYVKGTSLPITSNVEKIASFFQVSKADIDPRFQTSIKNLDDAEAEHGAQESQLVAYRVSHDLSAGIGQALYEDHSYDTVYYDEELPYDAASWISGDSMEPTYLNGNVALIRDTGFDYDGAVYAVQWDGNLYIKKVYREEDGLRLVSINKKYADKFAAYGEDPRIVGKIIGSFQPLER